MGKSLNGRELGTGISQRKDGRYQGRYTNRFGKRETLYHDKLAELKRLLSKAKYEDEMKLNIVDNTITLDEWFKKWINVHKYGVIRASTKSTYTQVYKKHIAPTLGKVRLQDITQLRVKDLLKKLDENGFGYETKNKVRILILDMFNKAMIDEFINKNPAKSIKLTRDEKKDVRVLTPKEQTEFFDACKGTFYDNLFIVAVTTGLRVGEISALRWEDIDFERNTIKVTRTLLYQKIEELGDTKKTFHINPPKTKTSKRDVPMGRQCILALKKQYMQKNIIASKIPKKVDEKFQDLLFTTKYNTPINSQIMCDAIKRIVDEINLTKDTLEEVDVFSMHCFRHTFATRCFEAGIQPKTVQAYLGHATLQMTMDLYTSVLDDHKQNEIDKLENRIDDVFNDGNELTEERFKKVIREENEKDNVINFNGVSSY